VRHRQLREFLEDPPALLGRHARRVVTGLRDEEPEHRLGGQRGQGCDLGHGRMV